MKNTKSAVYSISGICRLLKLSRGQFYILLRAGIFPPSLKDQRTGRSYYNEELKELCLNVKTTGISYDGTKFHLFYEPRKELGKSRKKRNADNTDYSEYIEILKQMGIQGVKSKDIDNAIRTVFPDGRPEDEGTLLRDLFKYFKNNIRTEEQ